MAAPLLPCMPGRPRGDPPYTPEDYQVGVKMRYLFHDGAATLPSPGRGGLAAGPGWGGDLSAPPEALYRKDDKGGYRAYLRNSLKGR